MEQQPELLTTEWVSDSVGTYLYQKRPKRRIIYIIVLAVVSAVVISLPFVYVDITVQSNGFVRPNGEISVITAPMTETVERVSAKEGDKLRKGDEILRFRTSSPDGKITYQQERSKEASAQIADLELLSKGQCPRAFASAARQQEYAKYLSEQYRLKTDLRQYETEWRRYKVLFDKGLISESEYNEHYYRYQDKLNELKEAVGTQKKAEDAPDLTRTPYPIKLGTRHPLTIVRNQIIDIFQRMGFTLAEGPEIDDDLHVFTKLNFAPDHPARDMQDTFFIETNPSDVTKNVILRSHTSNDQSRVMERQQPPIRVICPGRVFRNEAISARAHCFFHQLEGLYIDKNVSFTDLKQVLLTFARELFGPDTDIRLRPSYFPFTEPSAEMDISCHICGGEGCGFCKHTGWVEILGCGMVDPNVLEACGIDSTVYSGYAFGLGIERITNLKYHVADLRMFSENDVRFLQEFQSAN